MEELAANQISGPFTIDEAHTIFCGHFQTSPFSLIKKIPGDGKWQMICHVSKHDWANLEDFPTLYYSVAMIASFMSPSLLIPLCQCHLVPLHSMLDCLSTHVVCDHLSPCFKLDHCHLLLFCLHTESYLDF